jgi:hypothetical protein
MEGEVEATAKDPGDVGAPLVPLFLALCTKKRSLLRELLEAHGRASEPLRELIRSHIPGLIRTIGYGCCVVVPRSWVGVRREFGLCSSRTPPRAPAIP